MKWTHNLIFRDEAEATAFVAFLMVKQATVAYTRYGKVLLFSDDWYDLVRPYADEFGGRS